MIRLSFLKIYYLQENYYIYYQEYYGKVNFIQRNMRSDFKKTIDVFFSFIVLAKIMMD